MILLRSTFHTSLKPKLVLHKQSQTSRWWFTFFPMDTIIFFVYNGKNNIIIGNNLPQPKRDCRNVIDVECGGVEGYRKFVSEWKLMVCGGDCLGGVSAY